MIKPLNNHCLIEVLDEFEGVIRNTEQENVQKGVLRQYQFDSYHLTASTGIYIEDVYLDAAQESYDTMLGKTVYWQEYADAGSKFEIDGKKYVLVPFYRLIGFEE